MTYEEMIVLAGANGEGEALCPAHPDTHPSLVISRSRKAGRPFVFTCRSGCSAVDILAGLKLTWEDVYGAKPKAKSNARKYGPVEAEYIYRDASGEPLLRVQRCLPANPGDRKQFPLAARVDGRWRMGDTGRAPRVLYRLPELTAAPADTIVFAVEGEKCVERLFAHGLVATTTAGGADRFHKTPADHIRRVLAGRRVVVLPDNDEPGARYAADWIRCLEGHADVRLLRLPLTGKGDDVVDWLQAGGTPEQLLELAQAVPVEFATGSTLPIALPRVELGTDEHRVADEVIAYLAKRSDLYARGGKLVRVLDDDDGRAVIRQVLAPTLREMIAATVDVGEMHEKNGETFWVSAHPPGWLVQAIAERGVWLGMRRLVGIATAPMLLPDGSVLATPGYHEPTGILLRLSARHPPIPDRPTGVQVRAARDLLFDVLADFPFLEQRDRAAAIAAMFALAARAAIDGPVPLTLVRATVRASGKGLLVDAITVAMTGQRVRLVGFRTDDAEMDKLLLSLAREGVPTFSFDNVGRPFGGDSIDRALTSTVYTGRVLGLSESAAPPWRAVTFATGNGMSCVADTARRVIPCDLDPRREDPESRGDFRHPHLLEYVKAHWPELNAAALTILRAFHNAGRPRHRGAVLGSFEGWDALARAASIWCGCGDPDGRERLAADGDASREALRVALSAWHEQWGTDAETTAAEACTAAAAHPELRAALEGIVDDDLTPTTLGFALRKFKGRQVAGLSFAAGKRSNTGQRWRVASSPMITPSSPPSSPTFSDGESRLGDDGDHVFPTEQPSSEYTERDSTGGPMGASSVSSSPSSPSSTVTDGESRVTMGVTMGADASSPWCVRCGEHAIVGPAGLCHPCHRTAAPATEVPSH